jgi:hypothetical protein
MQRAPGVRILLAIAFAVSSLVAMAAPAAAETTLVSCSGTCGYYEVKDQGPTGPKGAVCGYKSLYLDFISVRPPLMHGNYAYKSKVAWRFKIQHGSTSSGPWSTTYTSSYQSAMASDSIPAYAGKGFARRWWYAPQNPSGSYRVWVEMGWWRNGSMEGFARVEYDHYKWIAGADSGEFSESCPHVVI